MKNKLLLSTALISGLISGSAAIAQTTVTGNLALTYKSQSYDGANSGLSTRGFGRESQVNVANKGKLNNGMNYAAGFSLEFDGNATTNATQGAQTITGTEANSISNENVYIDFISGNTTVTVGVDHIQNITQSQVPQITDIMDNVIAGFGGTGANTIGARTKEAMGFGIVQAIPEAGVTASILYAPRTFDFGGSDQSVGSNTNGSNSSYEVGLVGANTFGVKGLGLRYFENKMDAPTTATTDIKGKHYGASYATGPVAIGYERHKQNRTAATTATNLDQKSDTFGATFAVTPTVTLGLTHVKTDVSTAIDEKVTSLSVGYNLGPVALVAVASKGEDTANTANKDVNDLTLRLTTAF
ncbi:Porin domain, Gram-negative type [Candidatus Pelagibacterales bacterium]